MEEERRGGWEHPASGPEPGLGWVGPPAGALSGAWQLGMGEPTGTSWVVAGLFPMRVTVYFLITLSILQLPVPSQRAHIRNHVLAESLEIGGRVPKSHEFMRPTSLKQPCRQDRRPLEEGHLQSE